MHNKKLIRFFAIVFCLLCMFNNTSFANIRYPEKPENSFINDEADIFSIELVDSINKLNETANKKANINIYIASVRFLDGENKELYTKELFNRWELGSNDFLLLVSIGDEEYYAVSGSALEKRIPTSLVNGSFVNSGFNEEFKNENYNNAIALFFNNYTSLIQKNYNVSFNDKIIPNYSTTQIYAKPKTDNIVKFNYDVVNKKDNINIGNFILLILLIGYIINKKNSKPKKGCGCSTIIIIYIIFTLIGKVFN